MHLQSLEVFGFKSFADKTAFTFDHGVTAIVGPNGCGKSNVCDAVRWVLGEQSAKAMRGGEMADVIFNGTDSRKPLGYAEVSLTFTDCSSELGVEWHEVRVTRRVYRDGNSEYFLNKSLCRLKDIQSLFADTGVGRSAYSIMEQGKIDLILSSRPEDRRSVFEEAAGITKYRTQKKEALRKLEATEANLLRIGDIIKEVKRQIGSLQRQAGKARRYQALQADLQVLDTHFSFRKLEAFEQQLSQCAQELARMTILEAEGRAEITACETELTARRESLGLVDGEISSARSSRQQIESEIAAHRSRIEFNEQRTGELTDLTQRSEREIAAAEVKLREHEAEIQAANVQVEETARLLRQKTTERDEMMGEAQQRRQARQEQEDKLRQLQALVTHDELQIATAVQEATQLHERCAATEMTRSGLTERIQTATAGHDELQARVQKARNASAGGEETVQQLWARVLAQESDLRQQQTSIVALEKELTGLERRIAERESRHEVLRQLNEEGEGLLQGSQALLRKEQFAFGGALAAQLEVAAEFVPAIEAALGRSLHAIVLREPAQASQIADLLRSERPGPAAIALSELLPVTPSASEVVLPEGALGWADEKVQAPEALASLVRRLLGRTALFEQLGQALAAVARGGIAAATLGGEYISREGVLFAGSARIRSDSLLERKSRIAAIARELRGLQSDRGKLMTRQAEVDAQLALAQTALEQARAAHQEAHLSHALSISKANDLEREQHSAGRDLELLQREQLTLERQLTEAEGRLTELACRRDLLEASVAEHRNGVAGVEAARLAMASRAEELEAQIGELRVVVATEQQKYEGFLSRRAPMLARQTELTELIGTRRIEIDQYRARQIAQAEESARAREGIEEKLVELSERESELIRLTAARAAQAEEISTQEAALRETRTRFSELQEQRGNCSVRQTQLQMQSEHVTEHVTRRYQLDLRAFVPDPYAHEKVLRAQGKSSARTEGEATAGTGSPEAGPPDIEKIVGELTRQLDAMGPVNLEAVQEYDELEERYRFLETQNNDLTNSRRELLDVIARINSTTERLFADTFAQVRVNFREMFTELFGGGRADLRLVDENDALNCGIEIIAKPPGKQLQSVSLLSGGERTMAAVALLFAIYMVRPSPFCVLDEMDAPLDESNINRFIKMLERFVQQSQFIIITHNKRTIAKADILYGVTMEERGVSKLVGMKMTPAKATADNGRHEAPPEARMLQEPAEHSERELSFASPR